MVTPEAVRTLGGFEALTDERLKALIEVAGEAVNRDLTRLGLSVGTEVLDRLVALKTCELASRIIRTPASEGAAGLSAQYERLSWKEEYAKELNALRAVGVERGGVF